MVLSTQKMSSHHKLADCVLNLTVGDNSLKRIESTKFLEVKINSNLKWNDRIKHLAASCYGTLATLKKVKNFTNYKLRKHLAELLVLLRLDFSDLLYFTRSVKICLKSFSIFSFPLPALSQVTMNTLLKLSWLPMSERRDWHLLKAAHKALYDEH